MHFKSVYYKILLRMFMIFKRKHEKCLESECVLPTKVGKVTLENRVGHTQK